ncbi:MAG: trypsin-like peptidase domain-containing protein, partial [Nitrososphaeraceae archaeon]
MNKHLVEFSEKIHSSGPSLVPGLIMIFVSLCLLILFSTIQVNYYLLNAEAQLINSNVSNIGNNTSGIDNIIRNGTLDIGSNKTVQDLTLPELFEKAERSVVQVTTSSETGDLNLSRSGIGSGFVYNNDGLIVTNYHVISTGSSPPTNLAQGDTSREVDINVAFEDGSIYPATLVGSDPFSDVAVIDVPEEARNKLVPLPIGNSSELRVGQQVVAIGNPFGLSGSMTEGIVSGLGRLIPSSEEDRLPQLPDGTPESPPQDPSIPGLPLPPDQVPPNVPDEGGRETTRLGSFSIPDVIQTDAPINPGNSGGPLLDLRGNVIGMNTAIFSSTGESAGVGFAIPSNTVSKVVPSLISSGVYQHPWLGISGTDITPEIAAALGLDEAKGFLVTDITAGSPADKAGVRGGYKIDDINGMEIALGGDIIVGIDNNTVRKIDDILSYLEREKKVGDEVQLSVLRDGRIQETLPTILEVRPGSADQIQQPPQQEQQQDQGKPGWLGLSGTAITPEIAQAMGLPPDTKGYLVLEIVADGPADKAGIRGGYKIDNINGREIALGGDIIVGIDNMTVTTPENLITSLKGKQAGDTVQLDVIRNGQTNRVELTLGEIPQAALQGRQG